MSDPRSTHMRQQELVAALRDPGRYPHAARSVRVIETHISWLLLAGRYAYKIKKAIDLGFLDYSELGARRFFCEEEIRLNRRTAPQIYLDVVPIGGSPARPVLGAQQAIEYAVRMRRFASGNLMDSLLMRGKVTAQHIDRLAATIARFHAGLPVAETGSVFGSAASIRAAAQQNIDQLLVHLTDSADRANAAVLRAMTGAEYAACEGIFGSRREHGFVRECHGDLHLGNIVLDGDEPVPFDCIEFNPYFRWIDVMDEIAFTVMDLLHRNQPGYAWRLLNACLEASGDYAGVSVLRFYLAYRAAVRAKVCAIRAGQPDLSERAKGDERAACRAYLALARQCLEQRRPALIITHGLPGSGKTTFSQLALQQMGAIRIRSDVERKRIFGIGVLERSAAQAGVYSMQATLQTYARLHDLARGALAAGFTVIVDAAFLRQEERETFRRLAKSMGAPFAIASLHAPEAALRRRVELRRNDASEADTAVLEKLQLSQQPLSEQDLANTAKFTTEETPGSDANSQGWNRLYSLLGAD